MADATAGVEVKVKGKTFQVFCAQCQKKTVHEAHSLTREDVALRCEECGRIVKFPVGVSKAEFQNLLELHHRHNVRASLPKLEGKEDAEKWLASL